MLLVCSITLAEDMDILDSVRSKAADMKLSILKATASKAAGGIRMEIRNDASIPRHAIVIKAECYNDKGILKDELKARRAQLAPVEIWLVKSWSEWFRHWSITELSAAEE
jgi:hypothetical protein